MDKTIRKFASFEEMKAESERGWHALSPVERLEAEEMMLSRVREQDVLDLLDEPPA